MSQDTFPPTGMRDILPAEMELRDAAVAQLVRVYRSYGFRRIETPALESLRFLMSGQGGENEKLVFKVLKRGEKLTSAMASGQGELADLGLRFDLTVPLARYFAENHARLPHPLKAIQIGPVWRAERPQKGRFRQFTQCDIDILGVGSHAAEIELISATCDALLALGLRDLHVRLNDRRVLTAIAEHVGVEPSRHGAFFIAVDKLDKIGAAGVADELRAAGHSPHAVRAFSDFLDDQRAHGESLERLRTTLAASAAGPAFPALQEIIDAVTDAAAGRFAIAFDATLVRGMEYYTGPVFEITHAGSSGSIAGGGRYDEMIGRMSGREAPACGFSIGFERIIPLLQSAAAGFATERIALLYDEQEVPLRAAMKAARDLREAKTVVVSLEPKRKNLSRQLDELAAHAYSHYAVLRGDPAAPLVRPLPGPQRAEGGDR